MHPDWTCLLVRLDFQQHHCSYHLPERMVLHSNKCSITPSWIYWLHSATQICIAPQVSRNDTWKKPRSLWNEISLKHILLQFHWFYYAGHEHWRQTIALGNCRREQKIERNIVLSSCWWHHAMSHRAHNCGAQPLSVTFEYPYRQRNRRVWAAKPLTILHSDVYPKELIPLPTEPHQPLFFDGIRMQILQQWERRAGFPLPGFHYVAVFMIFQSGWVHEN